MKNVRKISPSERRLAETVYHVELSRGASIIASTLSRVTAETALNEVVSEFVALHGTGNIDLFSELLRERLTQKGRTDLATELFRTREVTVSTSLGKRRVSQ
ncbi:hypothetical protein [Paraburkholderia humisilvae]|uniref:Uncharacterized protein n=1 Tax=Paraburkholderia humisilvae TaxID=627669 RepID=A0A6J5F829_9BURK|nr:hypothetical protein [Paraburkholderia humisilvae]CAB3773405.1 hypothetical protein LMG29542_07230 [Paraburkholderia humisilvae]